MVTDAHGAFPSSFLPHTKDVNEAQREDHQELHHGDRSAQVELHEREKHLVGLERQGFGGLHRPAVGQIKRQFKGAQRVHGADDQGDDKDTATIRPELPASAKP